jgi:cellulose synthase/poly-beta-1,6-N-acetylglucosamine synthase-like glycosyltransferase
MVSILIAARNEEANIISCLQSVSNLSYPAGEWEVLIGNDDSQDLTGLLVERFIRDKPNFRLFHIGHNTGLARGKANVLAQLAHEAKGEYLFITDADIQVPSTWIYGMLAACEPNTGVVAGMTIVKGDTLFHHLQSLDWIYGFGMVHLLMARNIAVTAMGNNMLVTSQAYWATGGYEKIPFSITEDYALFHSIVKKGYNFTHVLSKDILAYSRPVLNFSELLKQRKRWMAGAVQLPLLVQSLFLVQVLLFPLALAFLWLHPAVSLLILAGKLLIDTAYLLWILHRIKELQLIRYVLLYQLYMVVFSVATLVYYFVPGNIYWKGRQYEKA